MSNARRFRGRRRRVAARVAIAGGAAAALLAAGFALEYRARRAEVVRLANLLVLHDGMTVAEIGAGSGWLTVEVARRVAPSGRVYSTELSPQRLGDIQRAVAAAKLSNVTVVPAGERVTNLPAGCCDAVFIRRVYHHLADPPAILASIREALRPGGRLVIVDFRRDGLLGRAIRMGAHPDDVIAKAVSAGFTVVTTDDWPGWDHYVIVLQKPPGAGSRATGQSISTRPSRIA